MTKKIFAMFLAVLMVVSMLPTSVFAAEATCPGKGQHTLENCSYTEVKVTEPGCGTMGFTTYQCNVCKELFSESWVAATGEHTWIDLPALAPTCAKPGHEAGRQCSVCLKQEPGKEIPKLGNELTNECEWVDVTPTIDCETGGIKKFECKFCGAINEMEIKPGTHTWDNDDAKLITAPTATADGLAEVHCDVCGKTKEVKVFFSHTHTEHDGALVSHEYVAPSCDADGMEAYDECRVCGAKFAYITRNYKYGYYELTEAEFASLKLSATHEFDCPDTCMLQDKHNGVHEATCVDTVLHCHKCDKTIPVSVAHNFKDWTTEKYATCTESGYKKSICSNCGIAVDTEILPVKGHREVTVSIPATCSTYAYTFTYCTYAGCNVTTNVVLPDGCVAEDYPMVGDQFVPVSELETGKGFYLATYQEKTKTALYFTGAMDGNFLAVSNDPSKAVKVYTEIVHPLVANTYRLFFYNAEGVKTYISVEGYVKSNGKTGASVKLSTTVPSSVWNWNATYGVLTTTVACSDTLSDTFFLGTYNYYETFSASSATQYLGKSGQYYAKLSLIGQKGNVNVVSYKVDVEGGFNANNHVLNSTTNIAPTCTEVGEKYVFCERCNYFAFEEIPAAHTWTNYAADAKITVDGKEIPAAAYTPCEGGYQYQYCAIEGCDAQQLLTYPGYGHIWGSLIEVEPDHINTVVYDYYQCVCGEKLNVNRKVWTDASKKWDTMEDAKKAHGLGTDESFELLNQNPVRVNCSVALYDTYFCTECKKAVYVKVAGTGAHTAPEDYVAPKCEEGENGEGLGGYTTYKCANCDVIIGDAALGEWNVIKATGHSWKALENYVPAPCDQPNYWNMAYECENCGALKNDGTTEIYRTWWWHTCWANTVEYYLCHCGEEHMRDFVVAKGCVYVEMDHYLKDADGNYVKDEKGNLVVDATIYQAPTCTEKGFTTFECTLCGYQHKQTLDTVPHTNAAGEKFTDKCTDTVEDRHCVVCCDCTTAGAAHDCTATEDANGNKITPCDCVIGKECHYTTFENKPSTCLQDAYTLKICGDCDTHTVEPWAESEWNGHRPTDNFEKFIEVQVYDEDGNPVVDENGNFVYETIELAVEEPVYLANYIYKLHNWVSVEIIDGEFVNVQSGEYVAKFIEYVEPTYTSEGYWTAYCEECKQIVTQKMPKKSGLGFELSVSNALGENTGYTFGSLIEVVVSANSNGEGIHGFDFDVDFYGDVIYVGYEKLNDNFNFVVTAPQNAGSYVDIVAYAVNDANGKMQNIAVTEDTALVKLYFRSLSVDAGELDFVFDDDYATAYKVSGTNVTAFECSYDNAWVWNRAFLDFNNDYVSANWNHGFTVVDLYQAMTMLTGEHPSGKTYDVTVDLNKDGEVTLEEISLAYEYHVGNCDLEDLFFMGIEEAEAELIRELLEINGVYCVHCGTAIAGTENYCPSCGRNPQA